MKKKEFIEAVLELGKDSQPFYGEVWLAVISEADWRGGRQCKLTAGYYSSSCWEQEDGAFGVGDFDYIELNIPLSEAWKHRHDKFDDVWDNGFRGWDGPAHEYITYTLEDMVEGFWNDFKARKEEAK